MSNKLSRQISLKKTQNNGELGIAYVAILQH